MKIFIHVDERSFAVKASLIAESQQTILLAQLHVISMTTHEY